MSGCWRGEGDLLIRTHTRLDQPSSPVTKLGGEGDTADGRDAIQSDPHGLEKWNKANIMEFVEAKPKVLHLDQSNPKDWDRLGVGLPHLGYSSGVVLQSLGVTDIHKEQFRYLLLLASFGRWANHTLELPMSPQRETRVISSAMHIQSSLLP